MHNLVFSIIGNGFVGGATKQLECLNNQLLVYDIVPEKCIPMGINLSDLKNCDFIFICVPTPMKKNGECNLSIVESVVQNLKDAGIDFEKTFVIIRSTVLPGTADRLGCYFMPEFLTEKNYMDDFINCQNWVIGCGKSKNILFLEKFNILINNAYEDKRIKNNNVISLINKEAELVKYTRNSFLALKVSFFNEIYELCKGLDINYDEMIKGVTCDDRIGLSHTTVPGHDGKFGYGGTCFPKDTNALRKYFKEILEKTPPILTASVYRNENIDRPEKDWQEDHRAYSDVTNSRN